MSKLFAKYFERAKGVKVGQHWINFIKFKLWTLMFPKGIIKENEIVPRTMTLRKGILFCKENGFNCECHDFIDWQVHVGILWRQFAYCLDYNLISEDSLLWDSAKNCQYLNWTTTNMKIILWSIVSKCSYIYKWLFKIGNLSQI